MSTYSKPSTFATGLSNRAQLSPVARRLPRLTEPSFGNFSTRSRLLHAQTFSPFRAVNASTGWDHQLLDRLQTPITRFHD